MSTSLTPSLPATPWSWRLALGLLAVVLVGCCYLCAAAEQARGQAFLGILALLALVASCSTNLRAVSWRAVLGGIALQVGVALFILRLSLPEIPALGIPEGFRPGVALFEGIGTAVVTFGSFTNDGVQFLFGPLGNHAEMQRVFPRGHYVFAIMGLPMIIFISAFFSVLYYFGILQGIVRLLAPLMMRLMGTSGAETLSAIANVFLGQTEAPLIVKPYVPRMTQSELLAVMVGGLATVSGTLLVVYSSQLGADPVALLVTSVMAAPGSLYLSKLFLPETEEPLTRGQVNLTDTSTHRNFIDAAGAGASDGLMLALNVAAMLIAFLSGLALINFLLGNLRTGQSLWVSLLAARGWDLILSVGVLSTCFVLLLKAGNRVLQRSAYRERFPWICGAADVKAQIMSAALLLVVAITYVNGVDKLLDILPEQLQLRTIFGWLFTPLALLIGVDSAEAGLVGELLGLKLSANEFVAFAELKDRYRSVLSPRAVQLATYALNSFANIGSIGILLGGLGAMAPERRGDLARLGGRALFVGFIVTLINAAIAGILLE